MFDQEIKLLPDEFEYSHHLFFDNVRILEREVIHQSPLGVEGLILSFHKLL